MSTIRDKKLELARKLAEKRRRFERDDCEQNLISFLQSGWKYIDPVPYVHGWHLEAIAEHLEAVAHGQIRRLLINVPPRSSKSSLVSVAFPAWTWAQKERGPLCGPQVQFMFASYAQSLSMRDSLKSRRLIESPWYQNNWGDRFKLTGDQNTKIRYENDQGGYRLATSVGGSLTGEGAGIIVCDDPHNSIDVESDAVRQSTITWWDEAMSTRLNDPKTGAYIVIMQRLKEDDISGHILTKNHGDWDHLNLPMEFDIGRPCRTSLGWSDPRTRDGELLLPERFGNKEVDDLKRRLGPYAYAGQMQQMPSPKGGGIIKEAWWLLYDEAAAREFGAPSVKHSPNVEFVIASLDSAYTEKTQNDPSALTVWGVFKDRGGNTKFLLMDSWSKRLEIHGQMVDRKVNEPNAAYIERLRPVLKGDFFPRDDLESEAAYVERLRKKTWGLVEWVAYTCKRFNVHRLLIEDKASGHSVAQEIRRRYSHEGWGVQLVDPKGDKINRAHSVVGMFVDEMIYAPDKDWAQAVITECKNFPKGAHDDLVDSCTQALTYFRKNNLAIRRDERVAQELEDSKHQKQLDPLYDV